MSDPTNPTRDQIVDDTVEEVEEGSISQQIDELLHIPDTGSYKVTFTMREGIPYCDMDKQLCFDGRFPSGIDLDEVLEQVNSRDLEIGESVVVEVDTDENDYKILDQEGDKV
jgi:hypothetical protein